MILDKTTKELQRAFDFFNEQLFNGELEKPIITIQAAGKAKSLAWCSNEPIWENKDHELKYELNIAAEALYKGVEETCHSLIHEMCHLYDNLNGIKDTNGKSHNKKFKQTAVTHGLDILDKDKTYGYGITYLDTKAKNLIKDLKFDKSVLEWSRIPEEVKEKEKKTVYKYKCPECGAKFTIKYKIKAICDECGIEMIMEEKKPVVREDEE